MRHSQQTKGRDDMVLTRMFLGGTQLPVGHFAATLWIRSIYFRLSILPFAEEKHHRVVWGEPCVVSMASNWGEGAMSLPVGGILGQNVTGSHRPFLNQGTAWSHEVADVPKMGWEADVRKGPEASGSGSGHERYSNAEQHCLEIA